MTRDELKRTLKQLREKHAWTQQEAAQKLGISLRTFINFEHGYKMRPRAITIMRIKLALESLERAA